MGLMAISREEVQKVSLLARLQLSEAELDTMTSQLGDILGYVELLGELDTENVEPMAHALDVANVFRDDQTKPSLDRDRALANAPNHDGECYRVPAVLGEG
jgi:aspartyl-tRNA(Asn)/glutamyl-tRNA(Gln) amidotransferase subunit C